MLDRTNAAWIRFGFRSPAQYTQLNCCPCASSNTSLLLKEPAPGLTTLVYTRYTRHAAYSSDQAQDVEMSVTLVQEATACGVKVADAKRVLKLMQSLEAALQADPTSEAPSAYRFLKARLEAAEQGGVSASFMQPAKARLRQLLMADVKKVVESALRTRPGRRAALKTGAVRDALDQAESMLESGLACDAEPFVASAQNWRALHVRAGSGGGPAENGQVKGGGDDVMSIPNATAVKRMLGEAYRYVSLLCIRSSGGGHVLHAAWHVRPTVITLSCTAWSNGRCVYIRSLSFLLVMLAKNLMTISVAQR